MSIGSIFKEIGEKVAEVGGTGLLKVQEHSPEILLVGGLIAMGGAVITGILAAKKHDAVMEDHEERLEMAKATYILPEEAVDEEGNIDPEMAAEAAEKEAIDKKEIARKVRREYVRTAVKMIKLYAPTIGLMALSAACFIGMHNIQAGRIAGLSTMYAGMKEAFDKYQERNIELNGQDNHQMCKYGWHEEEIEDENGEKKKIKVANTAADLAKERNELLGTNGENYDSSMAKLPYHTHTFWFDQYTSREYNPSPAINKMTINNARMYAQNFVNTKGFCTVNDVLDCLGMDRTPEGMFEGWVKGYGPDVDLGFDDNINCRTHNGFMNESILLDFNVHGNIYRIMHEIEEKRRRDKAELLKRRAEDNAMFRNEVAV